MADRIRRILIELDLGEAHAHQDARRYFKANEQVPLRQFLEVYPARSRDPIPSEYLDHPLKFFLLSPVRLGDDGVPVDAGAAVGGPITQELNAIFEREVAGTSITRDAPSSPAGSPPSSEEQTRVPNARQAPETSDDSSSTVPAAEVPVSSDKQASASSPVPVCEKEPERYPDRFLDQLQQLEAVRRELLRHSAGREDASPEARGQHATMVESIQTQVEKIGHMLETTL